ncbi:MAG: DMT family transporter [Clostridia bacterium]|nr:DMT family transporter [Clostridia bacterium]
MNTNLGKIACFACALIWGAGLVGQASGMDYMGPFSFTAVRVAFGAVSMIPLILIIDKKNGVDTIAGFKQAFKPAMICAPAFIVQLFAQQLALQYTSVGKCAFVTAFYIFIVPTLGLFLKQRVSKKMWLAVVMAMVGLYLITMTEGFHNINFGDLLSLVCAITYSIYMVLSNHFLENADTIKYSTLLFVATSLMAFILALILEPGQITLNNISLSIVPILITGVVSCGFGYTLQLYGIKHTGPNLASMILSSETVFSLLAGWIVLGEVLKTSEYIGCVVMTIAIVIAVLPEKIKNDKIS